MNFEMQDLTQQVASAAREFALSQIAPHVMEWDEQQFFPKQTLQELGKLGLMGILVPEEYGGAGLSYFEYKVAIEEIAKVCGSVGLSVAAHNSLCTGHILYFGNDEQKKKWLPLLASGQWIGAWGLTEANTGSDAGNMRCTATKNQDGNWVLNGTKNWITHGISGDIAVVLCRTGEPRAKNNATAFVVPRGTAGFTAGKKENKLGMRASETAELIFDNCVIPDSHRLGEVGEGFKQAMKILDGGRISIAALSLGIAKGAYEAAKKYAPKGAGAIVSFEIKGGVTAGSKFVESLELFSHVANIGDVRSLVIHPASTTHSQLTPEQQLTTGVTPGLVRLSVGLESFDDLVADLKAGFEAVKK